MRAMRGRWLLGLAFVGLLGPMAWADLCAKCKELAYTDDVGKCVECGAPTSSGAFKLCRRCSAKLGQCERCRAPLKPDMGADIVLGEDANGTTAAAEVKQTLLVKLAGNPTTGYRWSLTKLDGDAIEMVGKPEYVPDKAPKGIVGSGGTFRFLFRALKSGKATLSLAYARPWEKDAAPAKTFRLTVEVKAPEATKQP